MAGMISPPEFFAEAGNAHPQLSPNAAWVSTLYERSAEPRARLAGSAILDRQTR